MAKPKRAIARQKTLVLQLRTTVPALDPKVLHAEAEISARAILKAGRSKNTTNSYESALRYWAAWFWLRYQQSLALPVPPAAVVQFLTDHVLRPTDPEAAAGDNEEELLVYDLPRAIDEALVGSGFKKALGALALTTIEHRLSALSSVHTHRKLPSPTQEPAVRKLIHAARRAYASRGVQPHKKDPLTRDLLQALVATCTDGLRGLRDSALLQSGFSSGGRRVSEIVTMTMQRLRYVVPADGSPSYYLYTMGATKGDQTGEADHRVKPIRGTAAAALRAWLIASGITSGRIFRRMQHDQVGSRPLSTQGVRHLLKRRIQLAGLEGTFSPHSIRIGFVTEAGHQGVPPQAAKKLTGHASLAVFLGYFDAGAAEDNPAGNLLDN
jgi:site-specific recombinase XerD